MAFLSFASNPKGIENVEKFVLDTIKTKYTNIGDKEMNIYHHGSYDILDVNVSNDTSSLNEKFYIFKNGWQFADMPLDQAMNNVIDVHSFKAIVFDYEY